MYKCTDIQNLMTPIMREDGGSKFQVSVHLYIRQHCVTCKKTYVLLNTVLTSP